MTAESVVPPRLRPSEAEPSGSAAPSVATAPSVAVGAAGAERSQPWNGHERRSQEALHRLSREFDVLCTTAVDPAEIVAGLEAVGFTDRTAQEYLCQDLFDLAERVFRSTPRLTDRQPGRLANPWSERPLHHLLRGVSFALPGIVFVACLPRHAAAHATLTLTFALVLGWPVSQVMAFVGHTLDGRRHPLGARAVLAVGLLCAGVVAAGFWLLARAVGLPVDLALTGIGEIAYLAASAVILVFGREVFALAALAPGALVSSVALLGSGIPQSWVYFGSGLSVVVAWVLSCVLVSRARLRDLRAGFAALHRTDVSQAALHWCYAALGALLISTPALAGLATAAGTLALLPVIWSMGVAEWSLVTFRRRCFDLLNAAISMSIFRRQAWRQVLTASARYGATLTLGTLAFAGYAWWRVPEPLVRQAVGMAGGWLLGMGFFLALLASSLGRVRAVVLVMAAATGAGAAVLLCTSTATATLVAPAVFAAALVPVVRSTVGDPTLHM